MAAYRQIALQLVLVSHAIAQPFTTRTRDSKIIYILQQQLENPRCCSAAGALPEAKLTD